MGLTSTRTNTETKAAAASPSRDGGSYWLLLLFALTCCLLLIAGPSGNFPVNDDWLYVRGVQSIVETGKFSIPASNAFDFIPVYLGAFVCKLFGFSYETLRYTSIGFHLFGITGLYMALKELKLSSRDSALLSAVYALNPFMINLSLSYMTDVPALAFANWAINAGVKAAKNKGLPAFLLALLALIAAMSVRQTSLVLLPPLIAAGLLSIPSIKQKLGFLLASITLPAVSFVLLQRWLLEASTVNSSGYGKFSQLILDSALSFSPTFIWEMLAKGACYMGLFLFPVTLVLANAKHKKLMCTALAATVLFAAIPLANMQLHGAFMPYSLNLFMPPILGSYCVLGGADVWRPEHLKKFSYFSDMAALFCCFALTYSLLLIAFFSNKEDNASSGKISRTALLKSAPNLYLFLTFVCVTGGLLVQLKASNFDRYYLMALAPYLVCLAPLWKIVQPAKSLILSAVMVLFLGAYGTLAAMDVMNFNRAQWTAISELESVGIKPTQIDGGPAYTMLLAGKKFSNAHKQGIGFPEELRGGKPRCYYRWWPVVREDYIIASCKLDEYHAAREHKFWSPLRWKWRTMYTLEADVMPASNRLPEANQPL